MYICICNAVTDRDIMKAVDKGASSLQDLSDELKVATCCGRCADCANNLLQQACNRPATIELPMMIAATA